jgi:hypothetical protein
MNKFEIPRDLQNEQWVRMPKPKGQLPGLSRTTLLEVASGRKSKLRTFESRVRSGNSFSLTWMPSLRELLERPTKRMPRRMECTALRRRPFNAVDVTLALCRPPAAAEAILATARHLVQEWF